MYLWHCIIRTKMSRLATQIRLIVCTAHLSPKVFVVLPSVVVGNVVRKWQSIVGTKLNLLNTKCKGFSATMSANCVFDVVAWIPNYHIVYLHHFDILDTKVHSIGICVHQVPKLVPWIAIKTKYLEFLLFILKAYDSCRMLYTVFDLMLQLLTWNKVTNQSLFVRFLARNQVCVVNHLPYLPDLVWLFVQHVSWCWKDVL